MAPVSCMIKKSKSFDANDGTLVLYINIIDQDPYEIKSVQLYFTITEKVCNINMHRSC